MFNVYVTHPFGTFSAPTPEHKTDNLDSAIDYALDRIGDIVPDCRIWIETETGETLALMN